MSAETAIRRRPDGSIDTEFYARRSACLRTDARNRAMGRALALLRGLFARRAAIGSPAKVGG